MTALNWVIKISIWIIKVEYWVLSSDSTGLAFKDSLDFHCLSWLSFLYFLLRLLSTLLFFSFGNIATFSISLVVSVYIILILLTCLSYFSFFFFSREIELNVAYFGVFIATYNYLIGTTSLKLVITFPFCFNMHFLSYIFPRFIHQLVKFVFINHAFLKLLVITIVVSCPIYCLFGFKFHNFVIYVAMKRRA